ncbi:aldolase/citrate lyase family protein [Phaeobacter sp. A36a-5a]|uniref:HpcH/HpaI aldolase family protein n=1 Tax=Phaeobacter bryozoorum TaxID=1086632 RepID=UPI0030C8D9B7
MKGQDMTYVKGGFRQRFLHETNLTGSFLKIAHTMPAEILGVAGYDFVVVDEEHAPISREATDRIVLACKAADIGCLVRVKSAEPADILSALDCGADGILVPHVDTAQKARAIVSAARYRGGSRGYSPTTRAGRFGEVTLAEHVEKEDNRGLVIAMIEDPLAVEQIDAIVTTDGLDGVFIGRGDLTVAYGETKPGSEPVLRATKTICATARAHGVAICAMAGSAKDAGWLCELGVTAFVLASDQTFIRDAARARLAELRNALSAVQE